MTRDKLIEQGLLKPSDVIRVSDHAIIRYLERAGGYDAKANRIRSIIAFGAEIKPKNRLRKLLNNNFKHARYFHKNGLVVVLESGTAVTVYKYNAEDWL